MPTDPRVVVLALACASCAGTSPPLSSVTPRLPWCERVLAISASNAAIVPARDVAPADPAAAEALARRMSDESEAIAAVGDHAALLDASRVANVVSAAAWVLASRLHVDQGDRVSVEHALAIMLRQRERSQLVLRGYCSEVAPPSEPANGWRERAFALVSRLQPAMRECRERAPADERMDRVDVLVHIDPRGQVMLAVPVATLFEPNRWGPTDTAHCIVQRLEATKFPEPGSHVRHVALHVTFVANP